MDKVISIIVPVYQGEKTIERCIKSILQSTYRALEVLVVDDGSTDSTAAIVNRIAKEDGRVRLIQKANGGVSKARNTGLENASGEFIGFVDADDYIAAEMYEKMLEQMTEERDMVICGCYPCNAFGSIKGKAGKLMAYEKKCPDEALQSVMYEHITMAVWSKVFRRKYIVDEKGNLLVAFQEQLSNYEDFIFICEYLARCTGNMFFFPERLYYYCFTEGSLSRKGIAFDKTLKSLTAIVNLKEKYRKEMFQVSELFYTETVWKYWVTELLQNTRYKSLKDFAEDEQVRQELKRYSETYYKSSNVPMYKKIVVKMILSQEKFMFFIIKMARYIMRK